MAGQSNAAPVIIKRKKIIKASGHHGGAWKVAYADFVTAMMAFFMLMWLLNATTEKQRKGIADYFSPTIAVSRVSGGGDSMFGGDSTFSEETLAKNGTGASSRQPTESDKARGAAASGEAAAAAAAEQGRMEQIAKTLIAQGGESMTMQRMLRHVVTKVTDEGLVVEIFDLPDVALFVDDTAEPTGQTRKIAALIAEVLDLAENKIAVNGHLRSLPITLKDNPAWDLSTARAQAIRGLLEREGIDSARMARISGHADRKPATEDPAAIRNNRLEIILLRKDR
ncbi:flagellar motor protein MotB [Cypionkella sp.]|uniref:flagellar motor protein MotB n=1 Tax=Cypionkella sp. TaxID=2811411 RepID=UPI002AB90133|nr:flagellar motor protein MotB [Cypionkella sp.]MDZ4392227.1 flagellar motor protein MotB [Cypionkella sp.]